METKELKEFIHYLTQSKNISRDQRLKVGALLTRDYIKLINKPQTGINDIFNNADQVDNPQIQQSKFADAIKVVPNNEIDNKTSSSINHRDGVKGDYISPKNIQQFLKEYNQDEVLKYTCHLIDTDEVIKSINIACKVNSYDFIKHIDLIRCHFNELKKKYKTNEINLSPNIVTLINVYLFGKDLYGKECEWSTNKISINWNCDTIKEWAQNNPHIIPNPGKNIAKKQNNTGFRLKTAFLSNTTGVRIKSFSELVIFFKSQFHIRNDNSLKTLVKFVNENWIKEDNVIFTFSQDNFNENIELLTDVDKLLQAYKKIVGICIEHKLPDEPVRIELSLYDDMETNSTFFCIHHLNSVYKKSLKNALERIGEKQSQLIKNQVNGLCDLYLEAVFSDKRCARINLWDKSLKFDCKEISEDIKGVKYILKF